MILPHLPIRTSFRKIVALLAALSFATSNIAFADIPKTSISDTKKEAVITTDPEKIIIPRDYGLIKSRYTAKDSKKLIIHIQDAHCNYEAQSNIIKILECLIKNEGLGLISVEGADGFIDTSWFKAFPDADIRKEVADYFMKKGEITGPEFLSITSDYPIKLFGAETRSYYIENLNAFTSSYPLKEDTEKYFNQIKAVLNKLKTTIYNEELKAFDAKSQDYEAKKISFTDYVKYLETLAQQHKVSLRQYDNLFKLVSVLIYEKKIDFSVVDKERAALIDAVTKKLDKDQLAELVNKSLEFKSGKISSVEYYDYLKNLVSKYGISLSNEYPNLFNYIIYNSVYSRIENEKLFNDIKSLEDAIKDRLFADDDQRTLDKLSRHINILLGLVNIRLLNGDFDYYKARKEEFAHELFAGFINKMAAKYGFAYEVDPPSEAVRESMPKLEDFYALAVKRDKALVDNTIQAMKKEDAPVSVLVTGGFHSEGITKLLEKQDISYVVVCPNITKEVETPYIKILTNQRTPLEEILSDTGVTTADAKNVKNGMLAPYLLTAARVDNEMLPQLLKERTDEFLKEWSERYIKLWFPIGRQSTEGRKLEFTPQLALVLFSLEVDKAIDRYIEIRQKEREPLSYNEVKNLKRNAIEVKELAKKIIAAILLRERPDPQTGNFIGRLKTKDGCIIRDVTGWLYEDNNILTLSSREWDMRVNLSIAGEASSVKAAANIRKIKEALENPAHLLTGKDKNIANEIVRLLEARADAKGGKIYLFKENKEGILGFSDSVNIFIEESLANEHIAWFHEGGEAYFANPEKYSKLDEEGLNPHTYLRGIGYRTRLKPGSIPMGDLTPIERNLIRLYQGLGLQDRVFGERENNRLSRKIAEILKKETIKAFDFTAAILTDTQLKLIDQAASIYGLGEADKLYLTQMLAQYRMGQSGHIDLLPLKKPLIIMKDPSRINEADYNPKQDGNFILAAMSPITPAQTFKYPDLVKDIDNARVAKENIAVTANSLDAGIGEKLKRQLFLAKQFNIPPANVVLGAKGTDLGFHMTYNKRNVFISIAEVKLLQLALAASEKKFAELEWQPILNMESKESYERLLDKTICIYDRFDDAKSHKRTYRQFLSESGIISIKMINQPSLPGIIPGITKEDVSLTFATKGQPGGHGQVGFLFLYDAYHAPLPSDGKTHIRVFYNGDNLNSRVNEHIAGKMARLRLPIVKLTTPAALIDKKGGKDGDRVLKIGDKIVRVPDQMEEADAKAADKAAEGQLQMFYESGQGGKYGAVGTQPFNTNIFYINLTELHPILQELVSSKAISKEQLYDIITPTIITKEKKFDRDNQEYRVIDGAIGTAINSLNAFFMTHMDDSRIRGILDKRGIDRLLYFAEVPRTEFFTPVKKPYDMWLQDYSDYYSQIDIGKWILHDSRGVKTPPGFDLECLGPDKEEIYWDELQNIIDSLGKAEVRKLKTLTIRGKVLLKNAGLVGDVTIKNESDRTVDLNSEKEFGKFKVDDRLVLDNLTILIDKKGKISITPNAPTGDAGAIRAKGGTIKSEEHGTRIMDLRRRLKNEGYDTNYYKFLLDLRESQKTFVETRENSLNGVLKYLIEKGRAYAIVQNDIVILARRDSPIEVTKDKTGKMQILQLKLRDAARGKSFIVVKGLKERLKEQETGLVHLTDIIFHYGVTRQAIYIDEEDFNYLFSLPDGADIILEGAIHEKEHIDNETAHFNDPVNYKFLTEEEIENIAPSHNVRIAMALKDVMKKRLSMNIEKKQAFDGRDGYYKPVEKFAKFGTSGVRWLVEGASAILEKANLKLRIDYYISNRYRREIDGKTVLAEDFNAPNTGVVIKSIALYNLMKAQGAYPTIKEIQSKEYRKEYTAEFKRKLFNKGILVIYDNRPGNEDNAKMAARILAAYGIRAVLAKSDGKYVSTPLPAASRLVKVGGYAGSIMFTASHNGDEWNGIKFEAEDGAAASPKVTDVIGAILAEELALKNPQKPIEYDMAADDIETLIKDGRAATIDTLDFYAGEVVKYLNIEAINRAIKEGRVEFIYSAFFGSSGPLMLKLFKKLGLPADNNIIETQKSIGQKYVSSYEPTLEKLEKLVSLVEARGREIDKKGLKTVVIGSSADNDADRFQVNQYNRTTGKVDEYPPEKLAAILGHYLYRHRGFKGPLGRSFVTGTLQDQAARLFGYEEAVETATGFKFSPKVFIENNGVLFAEESYGLSFQNWILDKDGILPSLLALELVAATGKSLNEYYESVLGELKGAGLPADIYFKRYDLPFEKEELKEKAIQNFTKFFSSINVDRKEGEDIFKAVGGEETVFAGRKIVKIYNPKKFDGGMKVVFENGSWIAFRSSGTEPLIRVYVEGRSEQEKEKLKTAVFNLIGITMETAHGIDQKLHAPLIAATPDIAGGYLQGGYKQTGYGVPAGAAIDGSFAIDNEGNQGYYVNGGKEAFLLTVQDMKKFFKAREAILGKDMKYIIKAGIGGQHTPFEGIASAFQAIGKETERIIGEYELGKNYETSLAETLKKIGAGWEQVDVNPSSKSGATDETMMIFSEIFYVMLKNIAAQEGLNGKLFADTVFNTMHEINFVQGKERPAKDLFKGFSIFLVQKNLQSAGLAVTHDQVKKVFGVVLGNMFFETTDRPDKSRLSAFIRNSGLDKELGENAPGFGAMFDNVGGRWTADLHMMTFLAFHELNAEEYWNIRYEGIKKVREGTHKANALGNKIINEGITDIALIVPDELFWFGKAMEQNFNESIWQNGFANLIAVKENAWEAQKSRYAGKPSRLVINISNIVVPEASFNVVNLGAFELKSQGGRSISKQELANSLGELFTTFYGMTYTVGNALIARALAEKGYTAADVDLDDLNNPATKIVQQNLYVRQPYVELGKAFLEKKLKALQEEGPQAIEEELERIKEEARRGQIVSNVSELNLPAQIRNAEVLAAVISQAVKFAQNSNRKFVPFIYLEGEKFINIREYLVGLGIEWVMQGTGDQHISYQQVLAQPKKYLPFIISFVPEETLPGRPAIGFAKGYLHNVSPNMVRDLFADASYKALTEPRKNEAGEELKGAAGIFLRSIDSDQSREMLTRSFETAVTPETAPEVSLAASYETIATEKPEAALDHTVESIIQFSHTGERARKIAENKYSIKGVESVDQNHLIFVKSAIPQEQLMTTTAINCMNYCADYYNELGGYTAHIVDDYEEAIKLLAKNPDWDKTNTIVGLIDRKSLDRMTEDLKKNDMQDKAKILPMEAFDKEQFIPLKGFFDLMSILVQVNQPLDRPEDQELKDAIRDLLNEIGARDVNNLIDTLSVAAYFEDPIKFAKNFIIRLLPPTRPSNPAELRERYNAAKKVIESL